MPAVSVTNLYKVFGRRGGRAARRLADGATREDIADLKVTPAVIDATFAVEPGEIFVVMGLSGSGKSTLIRMLNGLLEPTSGTVEVDGVRLDTLKSKELRRLRRDKISMVFQHFALLPHRSVLANAAYALEVAGVGVAERTDKARKALSLVGLEDVDDKLPEQLSGGMKQRVGLARALAAETDILLMDEAFSALDPLIRREMQDQLLELQTTLGKTIVFITHDLNEAMRIGDRIAVMRAGEIVQIGTAQEILARPSDSYVAEFISDVDRTRVLTAADIMVPPPPGVDLHGRHGFAPGTPLPDMFEASVSSPLCTQCVEQGWLPILGSDGEPTGAVCRDTLLTALGSTGSGPTGPDGRPEAPRSPVAAATTVDGEAS